MARDKFVNLFLNHYSKQMHPLFVDEIINLQSEVPMAKRGRKPLEEKGKPGRKPGSKNKERVESESNLIKLALNQIEHANAIRDLQMAVNSLSQGINNLVQNTNKSLSELAKRIQASDSRVSDVEKAVTNDKPDESKEGESLT